MCRSQDAVDSEKKNLMEEVGVLYIGTWILKALVVRKERSIDSTKSKSCLPQ